MIFTDPPYNITNLKIDKQSFNLKNYLNEFKRILKPNGWLFCFGSIEMGALLLEHFRFKFQYVWQKPAGILTHQTTKHPMPQHENLWAFIMPDLKKMGELYMDKTALETEGQSYSRPAHKRTGEFMKSAGHATDEITVSNRTTRQGTTILKFPSKLYMKHAERTAHPTQKSLDMCKLICKAYCPPDGLILDCFMGSGTIPLAASLTNRKYIGIEINKEYFAIAQRRLNEVRDLVS